MCWSQCACTKKNASIEEKQRVRQPAVRYTHQNKQKKNKYIHTHRHASTHICMYDCMRSDSESELGVTLVNTSAQGCASDLCMPRYVLELFSVSVCLPVHTVTQKHTLKTQANTFQEMIENQHFHSTTVSQLSNKKHAHSLKR